MKKRGIRKTVTGGKIKETFRIEETEKGKEVTARKVFDDNEEVKKRGPEAGSR